MPRTARLDIPGLLHHVIVRGIERRPIFLDDQDRTYFLNRFSALLLETQTDCLAWSLLSNHGHLLLRPRTGRLSVFMRRLLTAHAVTFNLRHNRSGHLFQNRYKSLLCDEESYGLELVRYIHLNPLRAGLVNSLEELALYPWGGHSVVMGNRSLEGQVTEEVLERFGRTTRRAMSHYLQFIADGLQQPAPDTESTGGIRCWLARQCGREEELVTDERILGGKDFSRRMQTTDTDRRSASITLPVLLERVAAAYDVETESLLQRTRVADVVNARAVICYLGVRSIGCSGAEVARFLRMSRAGVSLAVRRGAALVLESPELGRLATS